MKYSFISDLHINDSDDESALILERFINHEKVSDSNVVVFLGDIFDLLIGEHDPYTQKYSLFFKSIAGFIADGKEVVFVEGNHDFHFEKTIKKYLLTQVQNHQNFHYLREGKILNLNGNKYYYCHGYEVDYYNIHFRRWFKIYTSSIFNFLISKVLTYSLIQRLGAWASQNSKKRGKKTFNYEQMRAKYLEGAKELIREKKVKGVIAGHTHVEEFWTFPDGSIYLNCGFPAKHKHFIHYNGTEFEKVIVS